MARFDKPIDMTGFGALVGMMMANGMMNATGARLVRLAERVRAEKANLFAKAESESRENLMRIADEAVSIAAQESTRSQQLEAENARLRETVAALQTIIREPS